MAQTNVQAFSGDVEISSNLAVDTNTLFVDSVGNKVGVGTTDPKTLLDVKGTILGSVVSYSANQDAAYLVAGTSNYTGADTSWDTHGFQHRIASNAGGTPRIYVDAPTGGEVFTILDDGNVGIGTDDPGSTLDVAGTVTATAFSGGSVTASTGSFTGTGDSILTVRNTSTPAVLRTLTTAGQVYFQSGTDTISDSRANMNFTSMFNATNYLTIKASNGYIGIGTNNPQDGLHVNTGNLRFGNNTWLQNRIVYANSSAGGTVYFEFGETFTADDSQQLLIITAGGNPAYNLGNFGMVACQHKSYGIGISQQAVLYNFSRQGSWTIGISNNPTVGSGTYIYANGVNASRGFKCRMIILNIAA